MRKQIVVCDMCESKVELKDWVHLPFRKSFISFEFREIDLCGAPCESVFWIYYKHYIGGTKYEHVSVE
jgi:hypothetical protein